MEKVTNYSARKNFGFSENVISSKIKNEFTNEREIFKLSRLFYIFKIVKHRGVKVSNSSEAERCCQRIKINKKPGKIIHP